MGNKKIKVKVSTGFPAWPILRQTPGESGVWGNCEFYVDQDIDECDYWVVADKLLHKEKVKCPPQNTLFITCEPPTIKTYNTRFLQQFAKVITCHRNIKHPHVIYKQQALGWLAGAKLDFKNRFQRVMEYMTYDDFVAFKSFSKEKIISLVTSDKNITPGHCRRLEFVSYLKKNLGDKIDIFGNGFNRIDDKWTAIAPYKYCLVIENCCIADYWTEKLADVFLGNAYPIYVGCHNIYDYFSEKAITKIGIEDMQNAVKIIQELIINNKYEKSMEDISEAKKLVLNKYNFFAVLCEIVNHNFDDNHKKLIQLQTEQEYERKIIRRIKNKIKTIINRVIK